MAGNGNDPSQSTPSNSGPDIVPSESSSEGGEIVVKFASEGDPEQLIEKGLIVAVKQQLAHSGVYLLEMQPGMDVSSLKLDLDTMSAVVYSHPNYLTNNLHPVQGSYPFSDQQLIGDYSLQQAADMLNLSNSHEIATGKDIIVAVLDGGVDASYEELSGIVTPGWDFVSDDDDPFDEGGGPASGHGTFVAGVVHLAAPDAQIKPYRVIDPEGHGDGFSLARAIERAVDEGCDVINISMVLMEEHLAVRDAINYAASEGVSVVASAGNEASATDLYPAAFSNVISVAAVDSVMILADFASYGANVDICAPGTMIYSTYKDGFYAWWSGSSFAAPFVAGQIAMLREISPTSGNFLLEYAIISTATNIDAINPDVSGLLGGGLVNPGAALAEINNLAIGTVAPDTLFFDVFENEIFVPPLFSTAMLSSTNAPAAFTGVNIDDGHMFSLLFDQSGTTNDSVRVGVETYTLPPGTYYDEVQFTIEGVSEVVTLTVCANVIPSDTSASAWIFPTSRYFQASQGDNETQYGSVMMWSSNAPAAFTAETAPGAQFTTVLTPSGTTNDSVSVSVNPGNLTNVGTYIDTVLCYVEGVQNPVVIPIVFDIISSDFDTAWVVRDSGAYVVVAEGATTPVTGWLGIYSSNAPANYNVEYLHPPTFSSLPDPSGTTNENLFFEVNPTGLSAGVYFDTMLVWVDGVANNPRPAIATLIVQSPAGDSLYLAPELVEFSVADSSTTPVTVTSWLSSTNSPMNFTGFLDTSSTLWMTLIDDTGVTDQNVRVSVDPTGFSTGVYYGQAFFQSSDADNTAILTIKMIVGSGSATAWATPDELFLQADAGSTTPVQQLINLQSSNAPAGFIGWSMNASGLDFVTLPDSSGMTNAAIPILADPTGLAPGSYADTVIFMVNDVENPVLVVVNLAITSGNATAEDLMNYPNPFNPSTNITFRLVAPSRVNLTVYNVTGQVVTTLVDQYLEAGKHSFPFDGSHVASGVYFYRLQTETARETRKMILVK
jgi:hypothetical protein